VLNRYDEEDIWEEWEESLEGLQLIAAAPGELLSGSAQLPWESFELTTTQPVEQIAEALALPEGWSVEDKQIEGAVGVHSATLRFAGDWELIRGRQISMEIPEGLENLAGVALEAEAALEVLDIGPAVESHTAEGDTVLATWGSSQLREGLCEEGACVARVRGSCGLGGVAGQLNTNGRSQVVLEMQFEMEFQGWSDATPNVSVFGLDRRRLEAKREQLSEGDLLTERWTWDLSGEERVAFVLQVMTYCHGWGDAPIRLLSAQAI